MNRNNYNYMKIKLNTNILIIIINIFFLININAQQKIDEIDCSEVIKKEYINIYDSIGDVKRIDTIEYRRICCFDESNENEELLRKELLLKGSKEAFLKYFYSYNCRDFGGEILFYEFIMAFKYKDPQAYFFIMSSYRANLMFGDIIEEENLNQMIIWIKKAAKKRHYQSRKMLKSSPIRKNSSREEKIKLIKSY